MAHSTLEMTSGDLGRSHRTPAPCFRVHTRTNKTNCRSQTFLMPENLSQAGSRSYFLKIFLSRFLTQYRCINLPDSLGLEDRNEAYERLSPRDVITYLEVEAETEQDCGAMPQYV